MTILAKPKRILFLLSDTGGGHRAAAQAIQTAIEQQYPNVYEFNTIDVFKCCATFPYQYMPFFYPLWVTYSSITWQMGYVLTDGRLRSRFFLDATYPRWKPKIEAMINAQNPDLIICTHSLINRAVLKTLQTMPKRIPFITVVTDLVSTPVSWYQPLADLCLVPTVEAYERGLKVGMKPEQMQITGLPVHPDFVLHLSDKQSARRELGWLPYKTTVLLVSGGDGMGPVYKTVKAINEQGFDIQLAIVAGRNERLKRQLNRLDWQQPTYIYPFVNYMATLMAAADILITKAGPATITEACTAGLPMILSGRVPGQEDGNVRFVVNNKAGVFAPKPQMVVDYLRAWLEADPSVREVYSRTARQLAQPYAAWRVADVVHQLLESSEIPSKIN
ncbi:MAG: galactosyldiacylglycerol synthase [Phototrophicales bacterium]|nr:MAG: galactosyldiacylglycerol synthase [Phototrophicales bacterium]